MSYIDTSTSSQIIATLTRKGRELLSTNSSQFLIVKFAFGDDEINYNDYVGDSPDSDNSKILSTPILEPATNGNIALRWGLANLQYGTNSVAKIESDIKSLRIISSTLINQPTQTNVTKKIDIIDVPPGKSYSFNIRTLRAYDSGYYLSSNNNDIVFENNSTSNFIGSYADRLDFDNFQNQSASDFKIYISQNILEISGSKNANLTIKGANSGVILNIPIIIEKTASEVI